MKVGTVVKVRKEWVDKGEDPNFKYIVVEVKGDRCDIAPYKCDLPLPPRNTVLTSMLEPCARDLPIPSQNREPMSKGLER